LFVAARPARWPRDALDIDVPHKRSVRVTVQNANDLVHPSTSKGVVRLETRTGKRLVYIARNCARLV